MDFTKIWYILKTILESNIQEVWDVSMDFDGFDFWNEDIYELYWNFDK